jgi:transposase
MAAIERKTKRYPTDLADEEWQRVAPLPPKPAERGRKPEVNLREVLNAIRYMTRSAGSPVGAVWCATVSNVSMSPRR